MKIYHEIDPTTKLFVTDVFYEEQKDDKGVITNPTTSNMIPVDIPGGLFLPKWDGKKWVEGNIVAKTKVVKEGALVTINSDYRTALDAGVTYTGVLFQSDASSISTLAETLTAISNGWTIPTGFVWIDSANKQHAANLIWLQGLSTAMADHKSALFVRLQVAKVALQSAKTTAAIGKVVL